MSNPVEVRGFLRLTQVFAERNWKNPMAVEIDHEMTAREFIAALDIPPESVEVLFVNRTAHSLANAVVRPGDRVALVPPGIPGPYRVLLGFKKVNKPEQV